MAAQNTAARARRIQQYGIKKLAIMPGNEVGGIGVHDLCLLAEAGEIVVYAGKACLIMIKGDDFGLWRQFEQVASFTTRGGTRIENTFAVAWRQDQGGLLRGSILHGNQPFGKAGNMRHVHGFVQGHCLRCERIGAGICHIR